MAIIVYIFPSNGFIKCFFVSIGSVKIGFGHFLWLFFFFFDTLAKNYFMQAVLFALP